MLSKQAVDTKDHQLNHDLNLATMKMDGVKAETASLADDYEKQIGLDYDQFPSPVLSSGASSELTLDAHCDEADLVPLEEEESKRAAKLSVQEVKNENRVERRKLWKKLFGGREREGRGWGRVSAWWRGLVERKDAQL
ncbi:hypothetical protein HK101_006578 [Irineochytrium annulatum]|nr:hypothetical protein HK101_006578 [Irineochytrium annulatum]